MATNPAQSRYIADSVSTATPAQLVVMLYDRLGLDLRRTLDVLACAQSHGTAAEARTAAAPHLLHAQQILAELLATLRIDSWDGAADLAGIYSFLINELAAVDGDCNVDRLTAVIAIVTGLHSAWRDAAAQLSSGGSGRADTSANPGAWVA